MIRMCLACVLLLFLIAFVYAQEGDLRSVVEYKVDKMKKELKLTDSQANAIRPVVNDYLIQRNSVLQQTEGQGIVDHVAVKSALKQLKDKEYQKFSKILNEDQLQKWIEKENLMATLNPDGAESTVDDGVSLTPSGADFKF